MDAIECEQFRADVAEGTAAGSRAHDDETTGSHRLPPTPASKVGRWFLGILASLVVAAILGGVTLIRWTGAKEVVDETQTQAIKDNKDALATKADRSHVDEVINVWTAVNKREIDSLKADNTKAHDDISSKLNAIMTEVRKGNGR